MSFKNPFIALGIHTTENVGVYQGCFWHCIRHDRFRLLWQAFDIFESIRLSLSRLFLTLYQFSRLVLTLYEFIKAASDTVLYMINAVYHDKLLIFIKAASDTVLYMINAVYHDKPLTFIKAVSDTALDMINAVYQSKASHWCLPWLCFGTSFIDWLFSVLVHSKSEWRTIDCKIFRGSSFTKLVWWEEMTWGKRFLKKLNKHQSW